MTKNPFARKNTETVKVEPGFVKVMFNYMKSDTSRTIRGVEVNGGITEFGTRFFALQTQGGLYSLPGRVVEAQDINFILNDGTRANVSDRLVGQTLNVRLDEDEFEELVAEAEHCEKGIGIEVVFMVASGTVNITKLTMATLGGEQRNSYTVNGELVEEGIEECLGTLVSDSLNAEQLNEYFNDSAAKAAKAASDARMANQAARQSVGSAQNLADSVRAAANI